MRHLVLANSDERGAAVLHAEVGAGLGPPAAVVAVLLATVALDSALLLIQRLLLLWPAAEGSPERLAAHDRAAEGRAAYLVSKLELSLGLGRPEKMPFSRFLSSVLLHLKTKLEINKLDF